MSKLLIKTMVVLSVFAVCLLAVPVLRAQGYAPSTMKVWGSPLTFPVARYDKLSGAILHPESAEIASRANFGVVRFLRNGMIAYFPNSYKIIPDSFVYTVLDSTGDIVHIKVMINPVRDAIQIRYTSIFPWRRR